MADIIVIALVVAIVGLALGYIIRQKRRGTKCIGCPCSKDCGGNCCSDLYTFTLED